MDGKVCEEVGECEEVAASDPYQAAESVSFVKALASQIMGPADLEEAR